MSRPLTTLLTLAAAALGCGLAVLVWPLPAGAAYPPAGLCGLAFAWCLWADRPQPTE